MAQPIRIFQTVPRIIFGINAIRSLGKEARYLGTRKVIIITDPGVAKSGALELAAESLRKANLQYGSFQGVEPDPPLEIIRESTSEAEKNGADLIVGLGGGSSMDVAKATAIMCTNEGQIESYSGVNRVPKPGLPTILIPTTAGTGSEVTSISVLSDRKNKVKKGIVSDFMFAKVAILDPLLTLELPPGITASTGLDALIHAIESYTGRHSTFITSPLALSAIELIAKYLRRAYADGSDVEARTSMLRASLLAGMAFANTQTGGAHACALAIGGSFHIPHGIATSLMLPAVMQFNCIAAPERFACIASAFGEPLKDCSPMDAAQKAIHAVSRLMDDLGFQRGLDRYGVPRSAIPELATSAMAAARLWDNNPRRATREQVEEIFRRSFSLEAGEAENLIV